MVGMASASLMKSLQTGTCRRQDETTSHVAVSRRLPRRMSGLRTPRSASVSPIVCNWPMTFALRERRSLGVDVGKRPAPLVESGCPGPQTLIQAASANTANTARQVGPGLTNQRLRLGRGIWAS